MIKPAPIDVEIILDGGVQRGTDIAKVRLLSVRVPLLVLYACGEDNL